MYCYHRVIFHCMNEPRFVNPLAHWRTLAAFVFWQLYLWIKLLLTSVCRFVWRHTFSTPLGNHHLILNADCSLTFMAPVSSDSHPTLWLSLHVSLCWCLSFCQPQNGGLSQGLGWAFLYSQYFTPSLWVVSSRTSVITSSMCPKPVFPLQTFPLNRRPMHGLTSWMSPIGRHEQHLTEDGHLIPGTVSHLELKALPFSWHTYMTGEALLLYFLYRRGSQPRHHWHFGPDNSLWSGAVCDL